MRHLSALVDETGSARAESWQKASRAIACIQVKIESAMDG